MKLLIDMNLSPAWVKVFESQGYEAIHWSMVGEPNALDQTIFAWAGEHDYIVFTHDLDFGAILAATGHTKPSVIQVRTQDVTPNHLEKMVFLALRQFESLLLQGSLITIEEEKLRARILPLAGRFRT